MAQQTNKTMSSGTNMKIEHYYETVYGKDDKLDCTESHAISKGVSKATPLATEAVMPGIQTKDNNSIYRKRVQASAGTSESPNITSTAPNIVVSQETPALIPTYKRKKLPDDNNTREHKSQIDNQSASKIHDTNIREEAARSPSTPNVLNQSTAVAVHALDNEKLVDKSPPQWHGETNRQSDAIFTTSSSPIHPDNNSPSMNCAIASQQPKILPNLSRVFMGEEYKMNPSAKDANLIPNINNGTREKQTLYLAMLQYEKLQHNLIEQQDKIIKLLQGSSQTMESVLSNEEFESKKQNFNLKDCNNLHREVNLLQKNQERRPNHTRIAIKGKPETNDGPVVGAIKSSASKKINVS